VDLDANAILASLAIGLVGFAIFVYGKRQGRFPHMLAGVVLMVFPYFVPNLLLMTGIAAATVASLWLVVHLGV
jgi:hypothetical protein